LPNIKSAKKRVLVAEARNARNKANKSALKTAIKKFEAAAVEGNRTEAEGTYKVAVKAIDRSAAQEQRGPQEERADAEAEQHWLMTKLNGYPKGCPFCFVRRRMQRSLSARRQHLTA